MSDLLDRLSERYHGTRTRIEIDEWGSDDEPLIVYSKLITVEDERRVLRSTKDPDDPEGWARMVFNYAEDEGGERIFAGDDFQRFKRVTDGSVLKRIGMQMYTATPNLEEAEKN